MSTYSESRPITNSNDQTSVKLVVSLFPPELSPTVIEELIQESVKNGYTSPTEYQISAGAHTLTVYRQNPSLGQPGILYACIFLQANYNESVNTDMTRQIMELEPQLLGMPSYEEAILH